MRFVRFGVFSRILFVTLMALSCGSCESSAPDLFPIRQNEKWGYINRQGKVVIQPQFAEAGFFSEGLAMVRTEKNGKYGYIDQTGKIVIIPQFEAAWRFSDSLASVKVEDKIGFIDKTGKLVISSQFETRAFGLSLFSDDLAAVKVNSKFGFIDKTGKFVIDPQFDDAEPFFDGLAVIKSGKKNGFIDGYGKFIIDPQFDEAQPFSNGLAAVKVGEKYGYIDKTGRIVINPQFDLAYPFSEEELAWVIVDEKVGFINKLGNLEISPQFESANSSFAMAHLLIDLIVSDFGRLSFSEGLSPVKNSDGKIGFIDKTGKFVIKPQFDLALPFYNGLALIGWGKVGILSSQEELEIAWVDKDGNFVWREVKEKPKPSLNLNLNTNRFANRNSYTGLSQNSNHSFNPKPTQPPSVLRTGHLITDTNLRSEPNKDAVSVGIHFRNAKVRILDETRYERDGEMATWYKVKVYEYGRSINPDIKGGKNTPNDADEGWVNAKYVSPN